MLNSAETAAQSAFWVVRAADRVGHTNTDINEPGLTVTDADLDALLNDLLAEVHAGDIVVLAGSLPKGAPQDTYRVWTSACKNAGARVFLDADGALLAEGLKPRRTSSSRMMMSCRVRRAKNWKPSKS